MISVGEPLCCLDDAKHMRLSLYQPLPVAYEVRTKIDTYRCFVVYESMYPRTYTTVTLSVRFEGFPRQLAPPACPLRVRS